MATFDAILPAGGQLDPDFSQAVGTHSKALLRLEGRTILERTLEALHGAAVLRRAYVVGPEPVQAEGARLGAEVMPDVGSGPQNIVEGLKLVGRGPNPPDEVLIVTTDLPFLSSAALRAFLDKCPAAIDFCVPLVMRRDFDAKYPGARSTFVRLREGDLTAGCAYRVRIDAFMKALPRIEDVFANRKSTLGMAKLLGVRFLVALLTKRAGVADVENTIRRLLHCTGAAIPDCPAELAYDIDALPEYEYAVRHLAAAPEAGRA